MKRELTNQELLDRYIHSIKILLPPDQAGDIAAEIASHLQSLVEDQTEHRGRELRLEELSAILKQHGNPWVVAARYRDQPGRGLISPQLFPLYWFTIRASFGTWMMVRVIVALFALRGTASALSILLRLGRDVLLAGFFIAAGVTLLFALWEYLEFKFRYSERWKPESLAPVPPPVQPPQRWQPSPPIQIIHGVVWIVFWSAALFLPQFSWVWGGRGVFSPSETVYALRPLFWLLISFGISQSWLTHTRFAAAPWRPFLRLALNLAGIAVAIFLLRQGDLLVAGPCWDPTQAKPLASLNLLVAAAIALASAFSALRCLHDLRGYPGRSNHRLDHQTANPVP